MTAVVASSPADIDTATATTTVINEISYNATTLSYWNYTVYENGTLSNGSNCFLAFGAYQPRLVAPNGTFVNTTSCYSPVHSIGPRGITGLVFGSLFMLTISFSVVNLRKHGRAFLPPGQRWTPVGRRWPWYWAIFTAACGVLSCFTAVDVDRDYVVNTPMVLQCFFFTLMLPPLMACMWESVRIWGSFRHRRQLDVGDSTLAPSRSRAKIDVYLPVIFYTLDWLLFFLLVPRSWSFVQRQRSRPQSVQSARPAALSARFRSASILSVICLALIVVQLEHGRRTDRSAPPWLLVQGCVFLAVRAAYGFAGSWLWSLCPYRLDVNIGWLYGLGYAPALLVLSTLNLRGYLDANEDKRILLQTSTRRPDAGYALDSVVAGHTGAGRDLVSRRSLRSWKSQRVGGPGALPFQSPAHFDMAGRGLASSSEPLAAQDETGYDWWQRRQRRDKEAGDGVTSHDGTEETTIGSTVHLQQDGARSRLRWTEEESESVQHRPDDGRGVTRGESEEPRSIRSLSSESEPGSLAPSIHARPQVVRSMLDV